jgi:uncharacterized protein Usg
MWLGKTSLVTAYITYRMPDHLTLLQDFLWQCPDALPHFPRLMKFLRFWDAEIEGPIHSVRISHCRLGSEHVLVNLHDFNFKNQTYPQ